MIWISSGWIDVQFYSVTEYKDRKEMYIESAYCSSDRNSKCGCDPFFFFSFFFFFTVMRRRQGVQLTSGSPAFALSIVFVFVCSILMDMNMNIILSLVSPDTAELIMFGQKLFSL